MPKTILGKIGLGILVLLVLLQFFRPTRNLGADTTKDISKVYNTPANVQQVLKTACYDCHSNYTAYPWYTNIQPGGLWMQHHVDEGKQDLNFSEFAGYRIYRQHHKMEEMIEILQEHEMPLASYTLIHRNAILDKDKEDLLVNWATAVRDTIRATYPADSLVMPKRKG